MSPGSIDRQQVVVPQRSPDALVAETHSIFLEPYVARSASEDQPVELTPSTTTATFSTPEPAHIQFTGIERHNSPRFIFYPISWDEPDNLLMAAEIDQPLSNLNTSFGQLAIRHDDLSDPLSAVMCVEDDPFDSIDHWRQSVVNCNNPWYGPFELVSFLDECGRSHGAPSEMSDSELNLSRIMDRRPRRIKARPKSLPA